MSKEEKTSRAATKTKVVVDSREEGELSDGGNA